MNKPRSSFRPSKRPAPCRSLQIMACTICLVHSRILSNISDLHPLDASGTTPPAVTTKDVPRHCQMSSVCVCAGGGGGTITLLIMAVWLRTLAIKGTRRLGQHSCPQTSHQTCSRMASPTLAPPEPHGVSDPSLCFIRSVSVPCAYNHLTCSVLRHFRLSPEFRRAGPWRFVYSSVPGTSKGQLARLIRHPENVG